MCTGLVPINGLTLTKKKNSHTHTHHIYIFSGVFCFSFAICFFDVMYMYMFMCMCMYVGDHKYHSSTLNAIREVILINPLTFYYHDGMSLGIPNDIQVAHDSVYYSNSMRDPKKWLKFLTGKASTGYIVKFISKRLVERVQVSLKNMHEVLFDKHSRLSADLLRITRANIPLSLLVSASDPGLEIVKAQAKRTLKKGQASGAIRVKTFAGANHTFSRLKHRNDLLVYMREKFTKDYQ